MKLDIGCGTRKREGFIGVDQFAMTGVDWVCDLSGRYWSLKPDVVEPSWGEWEMIAGHKVLKESSVDEVFSSHFLEHLTGMERVRFYNELYRVLKPGAKATIIVPHWASNRAYGDPTHQWPPVSEMSFYYLKRAWRQDQAPHTDLNWNPAGYDCDFEATWGYGMHQALMVRNQEYQQHALAWFKEAAQDTHVMLVATK